MPLAYLVATVVTGLGLLIGSLIHVSIRSRLLAIGCRRLSRTDAGDGRPDHRHGRLQVGKRGEGRGTGGGGCKS